MAAAGGRARSSVAPGAVAAGSAPSRPDVLARLERSSLLPAITFVFSRVGCDAAVQQCLRAGVRLTTPDEAATIRAYAEEHTADLAESDLGVLGYWEWLDGLEHGLAAHHAGLLPTFKEVVEHLFTRGLVKAVFATETLALGINMPARSVVLERLVKWNGETHADVTPGEYTQLTGRAGRRGIDVEGHAVVLWQPGVDPVAVAGLASTRTYPLRSSFRPTYNMAVNLVDQVGRERAREILETSFAQFQADRAVVGPGPAGPAQHRGARGLPRGDDLRPRRLRSSTPRCAGRSRTASPSWPAGGRRHAGPRRSPASRRCASVTSSGCRAAAGRGTPWSWRRTGRPGWTGPGPRCSPPTGR